MSMKKVYIAGPLFDDHERSYLEEIAEILERKVILQKSPLVCLHRRPYLSVQVVKF